jgi:transcriptional regulator with XRE-family HTH domain
MAMVQHERRIVERYEIDTLGAPFKVTLLECVVFSVDPKTGDEKINVPDVAGLIGAVVRARVSHPRKLNGKEVRFVRNALGLKANQLAKFLGMTPEHFSRCEAGSKVMAILTEKMFRLFAYLATYFPDPQDMLAKILDGETNLVPPGLEQKPTKKYEVMAKKFMEQFLMIKIQAVFDPREELNFEFSRGKLNEFDPTDQTTDEEEWETKPAAPRVAACG